MSSGLSTATLQLISALTGPSETFVVSDDFYIKSMLPPVSNIRVQTSLEKSYIDPMASNNLTKEYISYDQLPLYNDGKYLELEYLVENALSHLSNIGILTVDRKKDENIDKYFSEIKSKRKTKKLKL
jgi:hypothetical protein